MKTYNNEVVPKVKDLKPAQKPADMVGPRRKPFDYRIMMDIVYPSPGQEEVPVFVWSNTGRIAPRTTSTCSSCALRLCQHGRTASIAVTVHYWHFLNFTLDHWNGLACYTAAIRYLNKNADLYAMDTDHIGMMGISKGSTPSPASRPPTTRSQRRPSHSLTSVGTREVR